MRATLVSFSFSLSLALLAALAARAAEPTDAGPQPGDVVDPPPVPLATSPAVVDAGPAPVGTQPQPDAAAAAAAVDPTPPAPATAPAPVADPDASAPTSAPAVDATTSTTPAVVQDVSPRIDGDGERTAPDVPAPADAAAAAPQQPEGIGFGGVPALNYDADNGFGFGLVASIFYYDGATRPYRAALTLQLFMTSKLVQDHWLQLDWLNVGDSPLRLWGRVGYLQSLTQNYCGLGGDVTCDPAVAEAAGVARGLEGDALAQFTTQYYQRRFINPYANVLARYALVQKPARFEVTAGYRGYSFLPGSWDDADGDGEADLFPYQGSLYEKDFPDGEPGFDSGISLGFMVDSRDNEPAPTSGIFLETSVRASSKLLGSTWEWAGANMTLRSYAPITSDRKLTFANRLVFDAVVGDPPIQQLARVGGSFDHYIFGGSEAGRGIRAQRYLGKLRAYDQTEVRWRFLDVEAWGQRFGFTTAGFVDVGIVGKEIGAPGPMDFLTGFGGALRLSWNENFIIRVDLAFSPLEQYRLSPYIAINHTI